MMNETELQSATERFTQRCLQFFGQTVTLPQCYELLKKIIDLENKGLPNCFPNSEPVLEHNPDYFNYCTSFEHIINRYLLPLFVLMSFSNILTLLIYKLSYFDGSCSVNFLRMKAIANFIFVQSRICEIIHSWNVEPNPNFESLFWNTRPLVITLANISGTISTWFTLLVTIETLLCILLPFSFRQLCTRKTTSFALFTCILSSILLHSIFFLMQDVRPYVSIKMIDDQFPIDPHSLLNFTITPSATQKPHCWYVFKFYTMQLSQINFYKFLERPYYLGQTVFSIVLPTLLMLISSVLIVSKFTRASNLGEAFSQRRSCVIRLTIATTMSHLLLEGPAVLTFAAVTLKGAESGQHDTNICIFNHINNLLCVVNATIPFFVFLLCNEQFRHLSTIYIKAQTELRREKRAALLAVALNQRSKVGGGGSHGDRSFAGQMLLTGKVSNF